MKIKWQTLVLPVTSSIHWVALGPSPSPIKQGVPSMPHLAVTSSPTLLRQAGSKPYALSTTPCEPYCAGERLTLSATRGGRSDNPALPHVRLIDFGSALDPHSVQHLYGTPGPSRTQQTLEYAPPEATFRSYWEGSRTV